MRPLSDFLAEVRTDALRKGIPPLTEERRAEIRKACEDNIRKYPSPEAFAIVEAHYAETMEAMKGDGGTTA
jgi:hypothetical protein